MKIAIIAPSPVPFTIGGAEKLWWGLLDAINQIGEHQAELIKIPSPESNFIELIASYKHFNALDLTHFDRVISTKYPAWMVNHPDHHCYLQHKLRGLYDTYHFTGQKTEPPVLQQQASQELKQLYQILQSRVTDDNILQEFWDLWQNIEKLLTTERLSSEYFNFPGPLTRKIIHFLDNIALQPGKIKRYSAISNNVVARENYFPDGVPVHVIHHPSDLKGFQTNTFLEDPYIFTISRLDRPKRLDLLIQAFKNTQGNIKFRIAGEGPEKKQLQQLAQSDSRIQFIGRISDQQVIKEYAGALFIPFIPYDEDYGLITIEAMKSQKAVLTTTDAGGVNEFVEQEINGYSVPAEVESLTDAMNKLIESPQKTMEMGKKALQKVQHINWQNTVKELIQQSDIDEAMGNQKKQKLNIVVVLDFPSWPPQGGGQSRVYHLYKELARYQKVTLLALVNPADIKNDHSRKEGWQDWMIAPGLREIRIAKSPEQLKYQSKLQQQPNASVDDLACIEGYHLTPQYSKVISVLAQTADLFIASHPYLFNAIKTHWQGELWYEAHNVEIDLKLAILGQSSIASRWLKKIEQIEAACCQSSKVIMVCSQKDAQRISKHYQQPMEKMLVVANGVEIHQVPVYADQKLRRQSKTNEFLISMFMGSWHGPNIEAVEQIKQIALKAPKVQFLIMGSVCHHEVCKEMPKNCYTLGLVSEHEKNLYLQLADIAINPMLSGSGTNLKMLDYTANNLPVLSTKFGLRGLDFIEDQEVLIAPIKDFAKKLNDMQQCQQQKEQQQQLQLLAKRAKQKTERQYQWQQIAQTMNKRLL